MEVAGQRAVEEERPIRMAVRIDEPGGDDKPADLEDGLDLTRVDSGKVANGQDPVAEDPNIGRPARAPGPIDHRPAAEEQIEYGHPTMVTGSSRRQTVLC